MKPSFSTKTKSLTRRAAVGMAAAPLLTHVGAQPTSVPTPFQVAIPRSEVGRILTRARTTHFPAKLDGAWQYGAQWDYMRSLVDYWTTRYSWRKAELRLNAFPQYLASL